jgi:hypothetical protein
MKRLLTICLALIIGLAIVGCGMKRTVQETSDTLQEQVRVRDLVYVPAVHGSGSGPTVGMNLDGDLHVGMNYTNISTQEEYAIVFECQHGNFIIDRSDLWKVVHQDSSYTCLYREVYRSVYQGDSLISRTLADYDFLGLKEFPDLVR